MLSAILLEYITLVIADMLVIEHYMMSIGLEFNNSDFYSLSPIGGNVPTPGRFWIFTLHISELF